MQGSRKQQMQCLASTMYSSEWYKKIQKDNTDAETYQNNFHIYLLLDHRAVTAETSPPILSGFDYVITTTVRTTMPFPAAHPYCFLCANSSAYLACTKQIRERIQLEASQGEKKRKKKKAVKVDLRWLQLPDQLKAHKR